MLLHGPKFVNPNELAVPAVSDLFEQNRATHAELDGQSNAQHKWADQHQNKGCQDTVDQLFYQPRGTGNG